MSDVDLGEVAMIRDKVSSYTMWCNCCYLSSMDLS